MNQFISLFFCFISLGGCAQPVANIAITHVNIIDVEQGRVLRNKTVLLKNGKIEAIKPNGTATAGYKVNNAKGGYLIPGLIDAHVHATGGNPDVLLEQLKASLKKGVTAVRDMGGDGIILKEWKQKATELGIPDVYFSAVFAGSSWIDNDRRAKGSAHGTTPGTTAWLRSINLTANIAQYTKEAKEFGVDGIKIYADLPLKIIEKIVTEAHKNKLRVWSHATIFPTAPQQVIGTRLQAVSHGALLLYAISDKVPATYHQAKAKTPVYSKEAVQNSRKLKEMLDKMKQNNVYLDATLFIYDLFSKRRAGKYPQLAQRTNEVTALAYQRGVKIIAGTDALYDRTKQAPNIQEELVLLTQKAKLSNLDALRAATWHTAQVLGIAQTHGSIKPGKTADLVLLKNNPLINIEATKEVVQVFKAGKMVK